MRTPGQEPLHTTQGRLAASVAVFLALFANSLEVTAKTRSETARYEQAELERQLREVQRQFPLVARGLSFFQQIHAPRFCNIDEVCFRQVQDVCLDGGLPPRFCLDEAQSACCEPLVLAPALEPAPTGTPGFAQMTGVVLDDPSLDAGAGGCSDPKPADIGCSSNACKPCTKFICIEGAWEPVEITSPGDELCGVRGPTDPPLTACPRGDTGFCPAECSFCF